MSNSSTPSLQSKSLTRGFTPPFKPFTSSTQTTPTPRCTQPLTQNSILNVQNKSSLASNASYVSSSQSAHQNTSKRTSLTFATTVPKQTKQNQGPEKGTITSFFKCASETSGGDRQHQQEYEPFGLPQAKRGLAQEQKKNPPVAMVAPVISNSSCPNRYTPYSYSVHRWRTFSRKLSIYLDTTHSSPASPSMCYIRSKICVLELRVYDQCTYVHPFSIISFT